MKGRSGAGSDLLGENQAEERETRRRGLAQPSTVVGMVLPVSAGRIVE